MLDEHEQADASGAWFRPSGKDRSPQAQLRRSAGTGVPSLSGGKIGAGHGSERLLDLDCSLADSAVYLYRRTSLTRVDKSSWSRHAFGLPGMQAVTSLTRIAP